MEHTGNDNKAAGAPSVLNDGLGLVKRLRDAGEDYTVAWGSGDLYDEAADEIERLRTALSACSRMENVRTA